MKTLINGFRKCGVFPCDPEQLLQQLPKPPSTQEDDAAAMDQSLIGILTKMRQDGPKRAGKSKKVNVVAGKSVREEDLSKQTITTTTTTIKKKTTPSIQKKSGSKRKSDNRATSSRKFRKTLMNMNIEPENENVDLQMSDQPVVEQPAAEQPATEQPVATTPVFDVGSYVQVIKWNFIGYYAAIVAKSYGDEWEINYFKESGKYWVLKENDLDSRKEEDLALVKGYPDQRGRFTFE